MQPPITRYKDEPSDAIAEDIVNKEINSETQEASKQANTKLKVIPVEQTKQSNVSNIVNVFRQKLSNISTPIEMPSIGKIIEFKEISGHAQKELSKIALQNKSRADIMYCAMLNLINDLALEKKFDIRDYTEFERILITLNLQQMNKMNPEIKYTCPKCGRENSYILDTPTMLRNFSKTYNVDKTIEIESGIRKFVFVGGWPKVGVVEDFFKSYYKKYENSGKAIKESIDNLAQVEYITMFIKSITLFDDAESTDCVIANLEEMTYNERAQIVDSLPQSILFDDSTGVISKIVELFINPVNDVFKYRDCAFCGTSQEGQVANLTDFFGG